MSEKQKKELFVIRLSGEVHLSAIHREQAIELIENVIEGLKHDTDLDFYLDFNEDIQNKIEIELALQDKKTIDIISKAFNWTPEKFIEISLKKDVKYIQDNIRTHTIDDLRMEYNTGINEKILEEIL